MEKSPSSGQPNGNKWQTLDDVLKSINALSRINQDKRDFVKPESIEIPSIATNPFPDSIYEIRAYGQDDADEIPHQMGRGQMIKELQRRYYQKESDRLLHSDLREVLGKGFSNDLIEQHWGNSYEDSSFNSEENFQNVSESKKQDPEEGDNEHLEDFDGMGNANSLESQLKDEMNSSSSSVLPSGLFMRKERKSRNLVVLNLGSKNNAKETLLKPDDFLQTIQTEPSKTECELWPANSIFKSSDFPAL